MYLPQGQHCYVILCMKLRYLTLEGKKKSHRQKKKRATLNSRVERKLTTTIQ